MPPRGAGTGSRRPRRAAQPSPTREVDVTTQHTPADDRPHLRLVLGREPSPIDLDRYRRRRARLLLRQPLVLRRRAARIITRL